MVEVREQPEQRIAYFGPSQESKEEIFARMRAADTIAIDTETISIKDKHCLGLSIAWNPEESVYFPRELLGEAVHFLLGKQTKYLHNATFDLDVIQQWFQEEVGIDKRLSRDTIEDTSIMARVQGKRAALKELAWSEYGKVIEEISELLPASKSRKRPTMLDVPWTEVAEKCAVDTRTTWRLAQDIQPTGVFATAYQLEKDVIPILEVLSRRGIRLRQNRVRRWKDSLTAKVVQLQTICDGIGFNPGSSEQVGYVLGKRGNLLPTKRDNQGRYKYVTDETVLRQIQDPVAGMVLAYRSARKLLGTYVLPWVGQDRAYTTYRSDLSTGRTASSNRNIQNVPPELREVFAPDGPDGQWTDADASQVEMRIFAQLSQDKRMLQAYKDGVSVHEVTLNRLWPGVPKSNKGIYVKSKTFNFCMIFFGTAQTLSDHTDLPVEVCEHFRGDWLETYPEAHRWMLEQMEREESYAETMFGNRLALPRLSDMGTTEAHVRKCRINYPVQGTAAVEMKMALRDTFRAGYDIAATVHDELLLDGGVHIEVNPYYHEDLYVPWEVKIGPVWN